MSEHPFAIANTPELAGAPEGAVCRGCGAPAPLILGSDPDVALCWPCDSSWGGDEG